MNGIIKRLSILERERLQEPLIVLAKLPTGEEKPMSVDDMIKNKGDFVRVLNGSSLTDLDKILKLMYDKAVIC